MRCRYSWVQRCQSSAGECWKSSSQLDAVLLARLALRFLRKCFFLETSNDSFQCRTHVMCRTWSSENCAAASSALTRVFAQYCAPLLQRCDEQSLRQHIILCWNIWDHHTFHHQPRLQRPYFVWSGILRARNDRFLRDNVWIARRAINYPMTTSRLEGQ